MNAPLSDIKSGGSSKTEHERRPEIRQLATGIIPLSGMAFNWHSLKTSSPWHKPQKINIIRSHQKKPPQSTSSNAVTAADLQHQAQDLMRKQHLFKRIEAIKSFLELYYNNSDKNLGIMLGNREAYIQVREKDEKHLVQALQAELIELNKEWENL
mgnify:CR=1 FL=1